MKNENKTQEVEKLKGRAMLRWDGKRPLERVDYYPAQEKEVYGDKKSKEFNKLFWGDNLQVLGHLMKEYRGKVDLIYIDPPFDSKADYVKKVKFRGVHLDGREQGLLEEVQYMDIWEKDEYLQFLYERFILMRELLSERGSFFLHCDWRKAHYIKVLLDEVFGEECYTNEIIWQGAVGDTSEKNKKFIKSHENIFFYRKNSQGIIWHDVFQDYGETSLGLYKYEDKNGKYRLAPVDNPGGAGYSYDLGFGEKLPQNGYRMPKETALKWLQDGLLVAEKGKVPQRKQYIGEGVRCKDVWTDISSLQGNESAGYPTQKPEALLERIVSATTDEGSIVADFFAGSGTTVAVAQKLGRKWIGCDINIGAIQTCTKRLNKIIDKQAGGKLVKGSLGFKVFNVNDYDVFKNEIEAKEIVMEMYGVEKARMSYFDGVLDNRFVKVMPLNRVLSKKDMDVVIKGIKDSIDGFAVKTKSRHGEAVYEQGVTVFCSGLELDVLDYLKKKNDTGVEVDVRDILLDKQGVIFKQKPEAEVSVKPKGGKVTVKIDDFISPILMRKLEIENDKTLKKEAKAKVEDFRQIIDSVAIDVDYDGKLFNAEIIDVPAKNELIKAEYAIEYAKKGKQMLAIKIVDVLGEEYFETFEATV